MTQIKINYLYEVLLFLLKKESHGRELAKELKTSLTKIQSTLTELRNLNAIDYKVEGKNHIYFIKKNLISKTLILSSENYKLTKVLSKYPYLETIFEDIIKKSKSELIILFGSYAKETANKESDIDIYIETQSNEVASAPENKSLSATNEEIKKEIQEIYDSLSIKIGEFKTDNLLIKEIIKNHIIIKGGEKYYEMVKISS